MVDQVAVDASVSVFKRVDVDKAKSENRSRDDGIKLPGGTLVKVNETLDERWEILSARVDVIRQRFTRNAIMFSDEPTLRSQTETNEACV